MQTFSDMGSFFASKLKEVDEVCEKHNMKLRKVKGVDMEAICHQCEADKLKKENEVMAEEMTNNHHKRTTYDWLKRNSILLDDTLKRATFDNYDTEDKETRENKELALNIARRYYKGETFNSVLTGNAGTGKSHLAMSILKVVNEHSDPYRKCLFVAVDELMRLIKESFSDREPNYTEERLIEMCGEADLLVLDDIGAETGSINNSKPASDFVIRVLYSIMNSRVNKPTIITTNLGSNALVGVYDSKLVSRMLKGSKGNTIVFKETKDKRLDFDF